ncbi:MAG: hypothetical protein U0414_28825 [Polyangiaceae bacterium]
MTDEHEERARARLRSGEEADAIAADFQRQAMTVPAVAVRLLHDADESRQSVAGVVVSDVQEMAIDPLLATSGFVARDRAWVLGTIVAQETALRTDTLVWMTPFLGDRSPVEEGATARICDEAFLGLSKLLWFDEPELAIGRDAAAFLREAPARRDQLIAKAMTTKTFRRATRAED